MRPRAPAQELLFWKRRFEGAAAEQQTTEGEERFSIVSLPFVPNKEALLADSNTRTLAKLPSGGDQAARPLDIIFGRTMRLRMPCV